jgi:hypothetical protein
MEDTSHSEDDFKPTGTMAFVILLLLLMGLIWYGIYYIQLERHIK